MRNTTALSSGMVSPGSQVGPRPPTPTGGPMLDFNLLTEAEQLRKEPAWFNGHNAKTLVKHEDFRLVLMVMRAGTRMHRHQAKGTVCVQAIAGHLRVHVFDKTFELSAGQVLSLDPNLAHDLEATEESAFLLSIAWPNDSKLRNSVGHKPGITVVREDWIRDESVWN